MKRFVCGSDAGGRWCSLVRGWPWARPARSRSSGWSSSRARGATSGTNFNNGVKLAVKEINAARRHPRPQDRVHDAATRSRNPRRRQGRWRRRRSTTDAYVVLGPGVLRLDPGQHGRDAARRGAELHRRRGGGDHAAGQPVHLPHVVHAGHRDAEGRALHQGHLKAKTVAVICVNNDFGKGGRDVDHQGARRRRASRSSPTSRPTRARSTSRRRCSRPSRPTPTRCSSTQRGRVGARAARAAQAGLRQADRRRDRRSPGQKVIELAGDAANGAVAHVGLTADAPHAARCKRVRREVREGVQVQVRPQRHQGLHRRLHRQGGHREDRQVRPQGVRGRRMHGAEDLGARTIRAC